MYLNKELAKRIEYCIKQTHIEMTQFYAQGCVLELSGGAACFVEPESFFSQVIGWGFATKPRHFKSELVAIEQFYHSMAHPRVDIELCPYVGSELALLLSQRGYQITELSSVSVLNLNEYQPIELHDDALSIQEIKAEEREEWAKAVAQGFGYPEAEEQFFHYSQIKGAVVFAAYAQKDQVAGATLVTHLDICDLGVTSTLPAYRGLGLQKKLIAARLNYAKKQGLALATVTTEPGTISDLNIQKLGFHCAYTRIKMTLNT